MYYTDKFIDEKVNFLYAINGVAGADTSVKLPRIAPDCKNPAELLAGITAGMKKPKWTREEFNQSYVRNYITDWASMLDEDSEEYLRFGGFWWAVKDMLRKYIANGKWYCGNYDDPEIKERFNQGSEFKNVFAAYFYVDEFHNQDIGSTHFWYDAEGKEFMFELLDKDAPQPQPKVRCPVCQTIYPYSQTKNKCPYCGYEQL